MYRNKLTCLNLDSHDRVLAVITMVHSSDRKKDFKFEYPFDWTGKGNMTLIEEKQFYEIKDLEKDGFVHADGSLRFEFKIKKKNI